MMKKRSRDWRTVTSEKDAPTSFRGMRGFRAACDLFFVKRGMSPFMEESGWKDIHEHGWKKHEKDTNGRDGGNRHHA